MTTLDKVVNLPEDDIVAFGGHASGEGHKGECIAFLAGDGNSYLFVGVGCVDTHFMGSASDFRGGCQKGGDFLAESFESVHLSFPLVDVFILTGK